MGFHGFRAKHTILCYVVEVVAVAAIVAGFAGLPRGVTLAGAAAACVAGHFIAAFGAGAVFTYSTQHRCSEYTWLKFAGLGGLGLGGLIALIGGAATLAVPGISVFPGILAMGALGILQLFVAAGTGVLFFLADRDGGAAPSYV